MNKSSTTYYPRLFSALHFGNVQLKNRLIMPPMVRNYADSVGQVTPQYLAHIARIARGGVGTIILEASYIHASGKGFTHQLGLHDDIIISGLKQLVKIAHQSNVVIGPQLFHAGRQTSSRVCGQQPLAPSALPDPTIQELPRQLTLKEIHDVVQWFADAAKRANQTGCDFVELHAAHGYLITQFLSPFSNRRTDQYGGSFLNRSRFLVEVFTAVQQAVPKLPILVRLSADELVPHGITIKESLLTAQLLERLGATALDVSVGNYASYAQGLMIPPMAKVDGPLLKYAESIKQVVRIPVITVGKIRSPQMAEAIIRRGQADAVAIGRTLLADPDWPNKVQTGRLDEINPCIACNQGCISRLFQQQEVHCTVNPETSRELEYARKPKQKMTFLIIGGGPAGLEAARTAAKRGHRVILYEQRATLGGQLRAAAAAPYRLGWETLRKTLVRDVQSLGVTIKLQAECTPAQARRLQPDSIIIAVGSTPIVPKITGVEQLNVLHSRDVLLGKKNLNGPVVLIGGGCAGAQTAEFVAQRGFPTTLVHSGAMMAADAPTDERNLLLQRLAQLKVKLLTETTALIFEKHAVVIRNYQGERRLRAETIILCLGSKVNNSLLEQFKTISRQIYVVGDAKDPRRVTEAMAEGALAVLASESNDKSCTMPGA